MTYPMLRPFRRVPFGPPGPFSVLMLTLTLSGCAAMEGVNVGARVPIGGVVDVDMNKTIGRGQAPAPRTPPAEEEPADAEEEAPDESREEP